MTEKAEPQIDDLWGDGDTEWVVCAKITSTGKYLMRCRDAVKKDQIGTTKRMSLQQVHMMDRISTAESRAERREDAAPKQAKKAKKKGQIFDLPVD